MIERSVRVSMAVLVLSGAFAVAVADDFPVFRQGMWEYKRTMETKGGKPEVIEDKRCIDPTAERKKMNDILTKQGCKFSPVVRSGPKYSFSADCTMQGQRMTSQSVITVESESAYTIDVTSSVGGKSTKELLVAKRVGDCKQ